jgi:cell division septation protein DedD
LESSAEDTAVTDLLHDAADDGFHEIQLSGKQLVFLFMATTVVSVVIFLCGVLVGRNVRGEALIAADGAKTPLLTSGAGVSPAPAQPMPSTAPDVPAPAERPLTYNERLNGEKPVSETLRTRTEPEPGSAPEAPKAASNPSARETKAQTPSKPASPAPVPAAARTQPAQPGVWAVQVVALTDRAAATAVVQRLNAKGYPAFLVTPQTGAPVQNYKVQVGRFEDRAQAEQIAGRLKKEEQFQPWILR